MVCLNTAYTVPPTADGRLDELAGILARGVLRAEAKKSGCGRRNPLELPAETRLSVTTSDGLEDCEVT